MHSQLGETRALPERIVVDNGTEFTSKAMFEWTEDNGTKLQFIQPGKPTQNAFVEMPQRQIQKRMLEPTLVQIAGRSNANHQRLEGTLQRDSTAQLIGLFTTASICAAGSIIYVYLIKLAVLIRGEGQNERANALKEVKRLCKEFGFTAGMLKGSLAKGRGQK